MIITVTLNPAIDHTLVLPKFVAGDTIRVKSVRSDPGGKGINVSRVIQELGGESLAMGFAPGGLGRYIEQTLEGQGITCDFVHTQGETRRTSPSWTSLATCTRSSATRDPLSITALWPNCV